MSMTLPSVLTIAGSDSSGGAGIQADLKTIEAFGLYGSSAITALTAQNTTGVFLTEPVSPTMLKAQLEAVFSDIPPGAVKIGMAGSKDSILTIRECLKAFGPVPLVLDPVMVSTSGRRLLKKEDECILTEALFPLASLITPNIPEAEALLSLQGITITSRKEMEQAARLLSGRFQTAVLLKGGHAPEGAYDVLCRNDTVTWFSGTKLKSHNTHGTGCTLSSAIACGLAKGWSLTESIAQAKEYVTGAIQPGLDLGKGNGPLWHGWRQAHRP